jgi:DNA sulfur modification protein DndB
MDLTKLFIPALRGFFGDWVYYSGLVSMQEISKRVNFAKELHDNEQLSKLIQRELSKKRAKEICDYLTNEKERFFNSLVIAVYDGEPRWHDIKMSNFENIVVDEEIAENLESVSHSVGFLSFNGNEKMFALDGQHRLSGIKRYALESNRDEDVPVIFLAHKNENIERTRRLFTTLNKYAKPVSKGEIIALDENDICAIITRRLVEKSVFFNNEKIDFQTTNNLKKNNLKSLTTIGNLYDILLKLFAGVHKYDAKKIKNGVRPDDKSLNSFYEKAMDFFEKLAISLPELKEFFYAEESNAIVKKYRTEFGGLIFFRPIGLNLIMDIIIVINKRTNSIDKAINAIKLIPKEFNELPFRGLIWKDRIELKGYTLAKNILLYMLNEKTGRETSTTLLKKYRQTLEKTDIELPIKLIN